MASLSADHTPCALLSEVRSYAGSLIVGRIEAARCGIIALNPPQQSHCTKSGQSQAWTPIGVRPWYRTDSGGGFDCLPGVLILELGRAQISERGVEPAGVVNLTDEAGRELQRPTLLLA